MRGTWESLFLIYFIKSMYMYTYRSRCTYNRKANLPFFINYESIVKYLHATTKIKLTF